MQLWTRDFDHADKQERDYQHLPIEQKESYKWLRSAEASSRCLSAGGARLVTHLGDRESDLYEEWARVPDAQNHLLVRVRQDRRLLGQSLSLYAMLAQQPCCGSYTVNVVADPRVGRTAREAWMSVQIASVQIRRPDSLSAEDYPPSVSLHAIEAVEINPPQGQKPIRWRLLTTHEVRGIEHALQVIQWYCWRWRIEQLFATLKTAGLDLEATQLESGAAIQRLTVLALSVAVHVLQLLDARDNSDLTADVSFTKAQQQCLDQLAPTLQGRTAKQQNPYPPASLAWATWIIARLGGWLGYQSQRPPGIATLVKGLRQFESIFHGWNLARASFVCTP